MSRVPPQAGSPAFLAPDFDIAQHGLHLRLVDARPDVDARLHAVADLQLSRALHHGGDEPVVDRVFHNRAAGRGALLPRREERRVDHVLHRGVEIGIGQHDRRILAAHFQLNAQAALAGLAVQPVADLAGAGERDCLQRSGVDQRLAQFAARAGDKVDHALRNARLMQRLDDAPRARAARRRRA